MKNVFFSTIMLIGLTYSLEAQSVSKNAIGLRLGDNDGFGGEVSYQRKLGTKNRLELDLGWRNSKNVDAIKLAGVYQWFWNIDKGFYWFAGVGGGAGTWSYNKYGVNDNGAFGFAAGDIGIEYNFPIPIQLSLDFRPEVYFNSDAFRENNFGPDVALGVRYRF
jgi:hypothetical protein